MIEIIPTQQMSWLDKCYCIARLIAIVTILTYIITQDINSIVGGFFSLIILIVIYFLKKNKTEPFEALYPSNKVTTTGTEKLNSKNPLNNVLLTQIADNPDRKAAPKAFLNEVPINKSTQKLVQAVNPEIMVNRDLYGDLAANVEFNDSQRAFYSTANTRVENDQSSFANWCYGKMHSAKEGNAFALIQGNPRIVPR